MLVPKLKVLNTPYRLSRIASYLIVGSCKIKPHPCVAIRTCTIFLDIIVCFRFNMTFVSGTLKSHRVHIINS